jgi:hypothetical protein
LFEPGRIVGRYGATVDGAMPEFGERTARKRAREAASAAAALPLLLDLVPDVTSLSQVGFGSGEWLAEALRLGVPDVRGIDGPWATLDGLLVAREQISVVDTRETFHCESCHLAVCVEYAEHLPESRAASFIADLVSLAPVIAFSAAIPGQDGDGHVNEQWPSYWEAHFAAVGYRMVDAVRYRLWNEPDVPSYIAQNLLIAVDAARLADYPRLARVAAERDGGVLSLVHPVTYERQRRRPVESRKRKLARLPLRVAARLTRHAR